MPGRTQATLHPDAHLLLLSTQLLQHRRLLLQVAQQHGQGRCCGVMCSEQQGQAVFLHITMHRDTPPYTLLLALLQLGAVC